MLQAAGYFGIVNLDTLSTNSIGALRMSGILISAGVKIGI